MQLGTDFYNVKILNFDGGMKNENRNYRRDADGSR